MNEIVKFFEENPVQYLATIGRDNKADTPIFEVFYLCDEKAHRYRCKYCEQEYKK